MRISGYISSSDSLFERDEESDDYYDEDELGVYLLSSLSYSSSSLSSWIVSFVILDVLFLKAAIFL